MTRALQNILTQHDPRQRSWPRWNQIIQAWPSKKCFRQAKPACRRFGVLQGSKQGWRLLQNENEHLPFIVRGGRVDAGFHRVYFISRTRNLFPFHFMLLSLACPCVLPHLSLPTQMLPESWMTPLLGSPLLDSVPLSVHSTEMSAQVAKKAAASGRGGIFDHSNSLVGSESEMSMACAHCKPLIAFQERCVLVDQVWAACLQLLLALGCILFCFAV